MLNEWNRLRACSNEVLGHRRPRFTGYAGNSTRVAARDFRESCRHLPLWPLAVNSPSLLSSSTPSVEVRWAPVSSAVRPTGTRRALHPGTSLGTTSPRCPATHLTMGTSHPLNCRSLRTDVREMQIDNARIIKIPLCWCCVLHHRCVSHILTHRRDRIVFNHQWSSVCATTGAGGPHSGAGTGFGARTSWNREWRRVPDQKNLCLACLNVKTREMRIYEGRIVLAFVRDGAQCQCHEFNHRCGCPVVTL